MTLLRLAIDTAAFKQAERSRFQSGHRRVRQCHLARGKDDEGQDPF